MAFIIHYPLQCYINRAANSNQTFLFCITPCSSTLSYFESLDFEMIWIRASSFFSTPFRFVMSHESPLFNSKSMSLKQTYFSWRKGSKNSFVPHWESNCELPDLIHSVLDHRTTMPCIPLNLILTTKWSHNRAYLLESKIPKTPKNITAIFYCNWKK